MKRSIFVIVLVVTLADTAFTQQKKIRFHPIISAGLIAGASENNAAFQLINGVAFTTWYSGIGFGLDYYKYNTMPLFIDIRRSFGQNNKGFIYGNVGYNFPLKNQPGNEVGFYNSYSFKGGLYTDVGIGYKTILAKRTSVLFTIGHSYKALRCKTMTIPFCVECEPYSYNFKFDYGRIIFKTGLEF